MKTEQNKETGSPDRWVFYAICPIIALLAVHTGNENSIAELVRIPSYYTDLLLAFGLTFGTAFYLRYLTATSIRKQRVMWTRLTVYGVVLPTLCLVGIEMIYLEFLLGIPISQSSVFYLELPLIMVFCLMIVMIFLLIFTRQRTHATEQAEKTDTEFLVYKGQHTFRLLPRDLVYAISSGKSTFLTDNSGQQYLTNAALKEIASKLSQETFFRLNRQIVCRREAVVSFEKLETRKLKVVLDPDPGFPVFVSKSNASAFQNWLAGKQRPL